MKVVTFRVAGKHQSGWKKLINMLDKTFDVHVNNQKYIIEPLTHDREVKRYRVSTNCEYMFTLQTMLDGHWKMQGDVVPMNNELVQQIGLAIEEYIIK